MAQENFKISFSDGGEREELRRTLTALFATRAGSLPGDREFGISWECLDELPDVAENLFYLEALKKVEKYEPRVEIADIVFEHEEGSMIPHLYFTGKGEA